MTKSQKDDTIVNMDNREIEWTTLILIFPRLNLDEIDTSYSLIIDLCEHFNKLDRPDLWKDWLSLNLAEKGPKYEFSLTITKELTKSFGLEGHNEENNL